SRGDRRRYRGWVVNGRPERRVCHTRAEHRRNSRGADQPSACRSRRSQRARAESAGCLPSATVGEPGRARMTEVGGSVGGSVGGTRRLLRRLRDIMAGSGTAQERLDRIVRVIAAEMVAEVCSAYIMRAGEVLELFGTEG